MRMLLLLYRAWRLAEAMWDEHVLASELDALEVTHTDGTCVRCDLTEDLERRVLVAKAAYFALRGAR